MSNIMYDAIIIGGGHNGLTAAAYLAKAGRKVLVLEGRHILGGAAASDELYPGFTYTLYSYVVSLLSPRVISDLQLPKHGLNLIPLNGSFTPMENGDCIAFHEDDARTYKEICRHSKRDAEAYFKFGEFMTDLAHTMKPFLEAVPPDLVRPGWDGLRTLGFLGRHIRSIGKEKFHLVHKIMTMSAYDFLSEWFESDIVKAAIAASALNNISLGPQESGTAFSFLQNFANSNNGLFRCGGQIKGGAGALTTVLADAAKNVGSKIQPNSEVSQIIMENGRAAGLVLTGGKTISAGTIVSAVDMRSTFLQLVDPGLLDKTVLTHVRNITYCGTMARVHFALDSLPHFTGLTGNAQQMLSGHIQLAPTLTDLQKAFDPIKYGQYSDHPYLDIRIPTLNDPSLAPAGKHVLSATVKYIPYHLREGNREALRGSLGRLVTKTISSWTPDFEQCVQHCHVITPLDMETGYNLPEGSHVHGDITLDQSLWMRPIPGFTQYRAPVKGLYLSSAATHPGAGLTGINGLNAARRVLKDKS